MGPCVRRDDGEILKILTRCLARISHTTNRGLTVWVIGSRFRADFVFPVRSDRSARAGRVSASKIARLAGGDGRAGSVCGPLLAVLARRSRLKRYRGPDAPWRRLSCMDSLRPWRT